MKNIAGLLQELKYTVIDGKPEGEISELVYDSRKVTKDCMFVCIKGAESQEPRERPLLHLW